MPASPPPRLLDTHLVTPPSIVSGNAQLTDYGHRAGHIVTSSNLREYWHAEHTDVPPDRGHLTVLEAAGGSAALHGLRGKQGISAFVLHPEGRLGTQEHQMTTILDENIHNLAITGDLDDCQV